MSQPKHGIIEALGWYGVGAILIAYVLLSIGYLPPTGIAYQLLNLTGALAIVVDAWADRNYQPVALNLLWCLIALISIF